jgi:hypothetical protein
MRSGERCTQCGVGKMKTRTVFTRGSSRVRYLVCKSCGKTGKESLRLDDIGRPCYTFATPSNGNQQSNPTAT